MADVSRFPNARLGEADAPRDAPAAIDPRAGDNTRTDPAASSAEPTSSAAPQHAVRAPGGCSRLIVESLVLAVRIYQRTLGLILGGHCRFYPSCSNYFILAVRKHGPLRGTIKGIGRILRCHPFHPGGIDEP